MGFLDSIPTHMDYTGQKLAEQIFQAIIMLFGVVGFVWGYVCEQFVQTVYILGAGFVLSCILTLPPWPMYRRNPVAWQKPQQHATIAPPAETTTQSARKSGKRKDKSR